LYTVVTFANNALINNTQSSYEIKFKVEMLSNEHNDLKQKLEKLQDHFKDVEEYKSIIDRQDKRIEDINNHISWLSIALAFIGIIASWLGINKVRSDAEKTVEKWLNEEGLNILQNKITEAQKLLSELNNVLINANEKDKILSTMLAKHQGIVYDLTSVSEKHDTMEDILEARVIAFRKAQENNDFQSWIDTGKLAYLMDDYDSTVRYMDRALLVANTNEEIMRALYNKATSLYASDNSNKQILNMYDEIIDALQSENSEKSQEVLVSAMFNKAVLMFKNNISNELDIHKEIVDKYRSNQNPTIQDIVKRSEEIISTTHS
jgi:tetratricopeptide (TPR) repeat protein